MKIKQIASAVALCVGAALSAPAVADIYGGSSLEIDQLRIQFTNAALADASGDVTLKSFNFGSTNTAILNNVGTVTSASCNSVATCVSGTNVLDATAANATGSSFNRTNNQVSGADSSLTWFGIGAGTNWSNADSVIYTSEITSAGANPTKTAQIAEAKITSALSAQANSELTSNTSLTFNFSLNGPNPTNFSLSFLADPDMQARILNDLGISQSTMAVSVTLSNDDTGAFIRWTPDGTSADNCQNVGGTLNCVETADEENLNLTIGTSTNNTQSEHSYGPNISGLSAFGISASGLTAGNWTLQLRGFVSTNLTRTAVSEPGVLALLGLSLGGIGMVGRRRSVKK